MVGLEIGLVGFLALLLPTYLKLPECKSLRRLPASSRLETHSLNGLPYHLGRHDADQPSSGVPEQRERLRPGPGWQRLVGNTYFYVSPYISHFFGAQFLKYFDDTVLLLLSQAALLILSATHGTARISYHLMPRSVQRERERKTTCPSRDSNPCQ